MQFDYKGSYSEPELNDDNDIQYVQIIAIKIHINHKMSY